jgi:uncharacterized membrane protein YraQ (UPF0718 family)
MALGFTQVELTSEEEAALSGHKYWFVSRMVSSHASFFYINKKGQIFITLSYVLGFMLIGFMVVVFTQDFLKNYRWPYIIALIVLSAGMQVFISRKTIKRPNQSGGQTPSVTTSTQLPIEENPVAAEDKTGSPLE